MMKMTKVLNHGYELMKKHGTVTRLVGYNGTPHVFTPVNDPAVLDSRFRYCDWGKTVNRQTLNKLIQLGYAEYTDKTKNTAVFIDKDAMQDELERLAELGKAVEAAFTWMSLTDAPNAPDETICLIDSEDLLKWYRTEVERV